MPWLMPNRTPRLHSFKEAACSPLQGGKAGYMFAHTLCPHPACAKSTPHAEQQFFEL